MDEYVPKNVESPRGLSQEEALRELQEHPKYKAGSRISSIRQRGDRWHIRVLEPKLAEFPPKDDEAPSADDEVPSPDGPPSADDESSADDEGGDAPFPPKKDGDEKGGDKAELGQVLDLLHKVVEALGIPLGPDAGLGPDGPPGDPNAGPPPGGPPGHGGARPGAGRPPGPGGGAPPHPVRDIPPGASPMAGFASVAAMAKQVPSFTVASSEGLSIKEAKADLSKTFGPAYKVKQVQRKDDGSLHALLSVV